MNKLYKCFSPNCRFTLANFLSSLTVTNFHATDMLVCDMNVHATICLHFFALAVQA